MTAMISARLNQDSKQITVQQGIILVNHHNKKLLQVPQKTAEQRIERYPGKN